MNNSSNYSHLRIELSSECNLTCEYCRSNNGKQYKNIHGQISEEKIYSILDEAEQLGIQMIVFTGGGEPFIRKDIFNLINYGKIPKVIITNGTLLDENMVKKLSKSKLLSYLKISFDGFNAQEKLRGVSSVDKVVQAMKLLEDYDIPYAINTVLTSDSLCDLEKTYDFIAKRKAFSWGVYPLIQHGRAYENRIRLPEVKEIANTVAPIIERYIKDECPFDFEIEDLFVSELVNKDEWENSKLVTTLDSHPCDYQISAITIRLNGDVSQCSRSQYIFGNIYNEKLTDILNSKKRKEYLNISISDCNKCTSCKYMYFCQGGCIGRKKLMGIEDEEPDYKSCEFAEAFESYIIPALPENYQVDLIEMFNLNKVESDI